METSTAQVQRAVETLQSLLGGAQISLDLYDSQAARVSRGRALAQISDLILPRLQDLDAPLLVVVGGSTGAGKSTLVNSMVGEDVSPSSAIRPTTRRPLLVANEGEMPKFRSDRVLAGLRRAAPAAGPNIDGQSQDSDSSSVTLRVSGSIPNGMALLDAPDIDSISDANRSLATQLLDAADLWLFVTTAARYADAAAWRLLDEAAGRGIVVGVILNRVPPGATDEVLSDLRGLMASRGLADAPVFAIEETTLSAKGLLPTESLTSLEDWLNGVVTTQETRTAVARAALAGALGKVAREAQQVASALEAQEHALGDMRHVVKEDYENAVRGVLDATTDGSLLRSEVLVRWQDFVGTSDVFRSFEKWFAGIGDRLSGFLRGSPAPVQEVEEEITGGVAAVMVDEAGRSAAETYRKLRSNEAGRLLFADPNLEHETPTAHERAKELVHAWQGDLLDLIREETPKKRQRARALSLGLNTLTVALMLVVFASTGGLLGGEIAIAGGSAVLGQKLLETVFGDQAIRNLTAEAAKMLEARTEEFFAEETGRYYSVIDAQVSPVAAESLTEALNDLTTAKSGVRP